MTLKITLKPHEKILIGGAVIRNGPAKAEFAVENKTPILRQSHILSPDSANTPARRIYLAIQLIYIDKLQLADHLKLYWQLVDEFIAAAPSSLALIDRMNELILAEKYYQALKSAQKLIDFEQEVIDRVANCT